MASIQISWTQFKAEAAARLLPMQYVETSEFYYLCCFDGLLELTCRLTKDAGADQTDFEGNFKAAANKTPSQLKPFGDAQGYKSLLKGYTGTAAVNATTNLDIPVAVEVHLISVLMILANQAAADNMDMVVIDKNNVLGFGANFIYYTWMSTWYVQTDSQSQQEIKAPFPLRIPAGLFFRITYRATGVLTPVTVKGNFYLYTKV